MSPAWVQLELGIAESLACRYPNVDLLPIPRPGVRGGLVLITAHTLLPEADVTTLPWVAAEEVAAGLSGPLRSELANRANYATEFVTDQRLLDLRDQLMTRLATASDQEAALQVAARVHLTRAALGIVPYPIGVRCLTWYSAFLGDHWPITQVFRTASTLTQRWSEHAELRPSVETQMASLAHSVVSANPVDLLDLSL